MTDLTCGLATAQEDGSGLNGSGLEGVELNAMSYNTLIQAMERAEQWDRVLEVSGCKGLRVCGSAGLRVCGSTLCLRVSAGLWVFTGQPVCGCPTTRSNRPWSGQSSGTGC
jgi:hypothetical protein